MRSPEEIASLMAAMSFGEQIQIDQTTYRCRLVDAWGIPEGARILEIGCGQGDMTAVLAEAVGDQGHITGVDYAPLTYGAPVNVGDSSAHLLTGPLGSRMTFHFDVNLPDPNLTFPDDAFDYVVFAHSAWYFEDQETVRQVLEHVRPWAKRLCFAEWDFEPESFDQVPHLLAVLIQGQVEVAKHGSNANVRTPFSKQRCLELLKQTGWLPGSIVQIDATGTHDLVWEIGYALNASPEELPSIPILAKAKDLILSQIDLLAALTARIEPRPLPVYALVADRQAS